MAKGRAGAEAGRKRPARKRRRPTPAAQRRRRAIELLVQGERIQKVAAELGVNERTVRKWMDEEEFAAELEAESTAIREAARRKLSAAVDEALEVHLANMKRATAKRIREAQRDRATAQRAAESILDRVGIERTTGTKVSGDVRVQHVDDPFEGRSAEELEHFAVHGRFPPRKKNDPTPGTPVDDSTG